MLIISQGINSRHAGKFRELLEIALRVSANDRAMNHPSKDTGRVLDQFAATELRVGGVQVNRFPSELTNSDFKRNARARRRFGKNQRPGLAGERLRRNLAAIRLELGCPLQNPFDLVAGELFDTEEML